MNNGRRFTVGLSFLMLYFCVFNIKAQALINTDSLTRNLEKLLASSTVGDKLLLYQELEKLIASPNEADMALAIPYYSKLGKPKMVDSVLKMEIKYFPKGTEARRIAANMIYQAVNAAEKENAYDDWIKKFPPDHFPNLKIDDRLIYDYVRSALANDFEKEGNTPKAIQYIKMLEVEFWKGSAYSSLADAFYKNADLPNAEIYTKKALDNAESYTEAKRGMSNAAMFAASGYAGLCDTYAGILYEEKKYEEALHYVKLSYKNAKTVSPLINLRYAVILMTLNRNQEAFDKLTEVAKVGKSNPEITDTLKKLYVKLNGGEAGFDSYSRELNSGAMDNLKKKLTDEMVNEKACDFTLNDLNGNKVSLSDLKGKVVVLDFWAIWCGPCKASFPAMQMALNKYKNDQNVKFIFIHTWEKSDQPEQDAVNYIKKMNYNFQVLMDLKDPVTKENKVVSIYKVSGIPAKFIIDDNGNIRFKLTGFGGSKEAAVDELSMMIEMTKKSKSN